MRTLLIATLGLFLVGCATTQTEIRTEYIREAPAKVAIPDEPTYLVEALPGNAEASAILQALSVDMHQCIAYSDTLRERLETQNNNNTESQNEPRRDPADRRGHPGVPSNPDQGRERQPAE